MPAPRKYKRSDTASSIVTTNTSQMDWMEKQTHSLSKLMGRSSGCLRMCSVYAEEQVEYERRQEGDNYLASMDRMIKAGQAVSNSAGSLQVELYRQFLFDEESVLSSVTERDDEGLSSMSVASGNHSQQQNSVMRRMPPPDEDKSIKSTHSHDYQAIVTQRSH